MMNSPSFINNASFNASFNTSRRHPRDGTVLMSNGYTHTLEPHPPPLPAMLKVALSSTDNRHSSCRLDPSGWGWLVAGRKLYVWRHTQDANAPNSKKFSCRELLLPPSELVHAAKLVAVLPTGVSSPPSLLAVSPEGSITFWPSVANESNTVTLNADIPGQECEGLTSIWPIGAILTTTSGTVLVIKISGGRGNNVKPGLSCNPLLVQKGWLGGWSKKVTTMLFTQVPHATSGLDGKRARVVVPMSKEDDPSYPGNNKEGKVYIFQGSVLQCWTFTPESQLCAPEVNLDESLRRQFLDYVWSDENLSSSSRRHPNDLLRGIQTWILDVASVPGTGSDGRRLGALVAARSQSETSDALVYGIVSFEVKRHRQRECWGFVPLTVSPEVLEEDEQLYGWKLYATNSGFFVVSHDCVHTISDKSEVATDVIESSVLGGPVIGAGNVTPNTVVILVPKLGLLTIKPAPITDGMGLDETFAEVSRVPDHLALSMSAANLADLNMSEDLVLRYKAAFILFLQKKNEECVEMLGELFPQHGGSMSPHDPLDISTIAFTEKVIDEAPVADPRWGSSFRTDEQDPLGLKSKILIKNFLVDKREGLELFFGFLNSVGIWPRLEGVVVRDEVVATGSLLYNAYEKIYFALSLQNLQSEGQFRKIIDTAVRSIVVMRREKDATARSSHLSPNDLFYKEVSTVHQIIPALVSIEEDEISRLASVEIPSRLGLTNEVILRALLEVNAIACSGSGEKLGQVYDFLIRPLMASESNEYQVIPWIVQENVLGSLVRQHELTVNQGLSNSEVDLELKVELLKHLAQLTDLILDALKTNLLSIQSSERYPGKLQTFENLRGRLLTSHLQIGDYEGGAILGEKYLDFEILANICYDKKDFQSLAQYFRKYEELGFQEFVFEWYVRQKKSAELVDNFSNTEFRARLEKFLEQYPQIAWHAATAVDDYANAAGILRGLAEGEQNYVDDKKFLLCMSKLAALASSPSRPNANVEVTEFVEGIDRNLRLTEFQDRLPDEILNVYGLDRVSMRVLSPSEMIDMYTTEDVGFDAGNYTNALALSEFMINEELQIEKRLLIAARAIRRDPWDQWSTDHPMDVVSVSALYHYVLGALGQGWTLNEVYPLPAVLTFPQVKGFTENNASVSFLLRAAHEFIITTINEEVKAANTQRDVQMAE